MPCHHALAEALRAYIDTAGIAEDRKGWLFRTSPRHNATVLTEQPMAQADAWRMIRRRAPAAGIMAPIGNHTFRATGITAYLGNGGVLEHAQSMAAHESPRTTKLYDRTQERLTQDEVERIRLQALGDGLPMELRSCTGGLRDGTALRDDLASPLAAQASATDAPSIFGQWSI